MKITLPGFPAEVSERIDMPDIGELLLYPAFQGIVADDFLKHATDFQRYLFSKVPIRNDKRNVLVRSGVWLLQPHTRSHVNRTGDWHIDGVSDFDHLKPEERVFILSSPCQALTEFNGEPLEIESSECETRVQLIKRICRDPEKFGVIARQIEPCRIYMFDNHLHRAVEPKRIEFRFFLRVRETDTPGFTTEPLREVLLRDSITGKDHLHIEYHRDKLSIYFPRASPEHHATLLRSEA
jgi:hypothetical protein